MKNLQIPPITYEMARSLVKPMKVRNANDVAKALIEQEFKKEGGISFLNSIRVSPNIRPENLTLEEFCKLEFALRKL